MPIHIESTQYENSREYYINIINESLNHTFQDIIDTEIPYNQQLVRNILSEHAHYELKDFIDKNPGLPVDFNMWFKLSKEILEHSNPIYDKMLDKLYSEQRIKKSFNFSLFRNSDSRIIESAGILGSLLGSIFTVMCCVLFAVPIGIMTGICLSEFMPKNNFTNIIESSINNLAAVPSIIFGILGFTIYLSVFNFPRSSALVGGLTLSLMMLPNLIIATKNALASVPLYIKDGALALGASHIEVLVHHSLPISFPSILQGTILAIARVLGESSPLLMVGMVAFVSEAPKSFLDPTTVLPVQIYMWSSNPSIEFIQLAAVAIIFLLLMLLVLNLIVGFVRRKSEFFIF